MARTRALPRAAHLAARRAQRGHRRLRDSAAHRARAQRLSRL